MRKSPRQRRLEADFRSVEKLDAESSIFSFHASGDPPARYRLQFSGPGICRDSYGKIQITEKHEVIVELGASYPRMVPNLLWQTPIFHPNISNNGVVCLGGYGTHWVPSLTLDEMSTMLWDMIRYENFDIQSPYNREAALWARDQRKFSFPLDGQSIRNRVNSPEENRHPFQTSVELVEEKKSPSSKPFFSVMALADRIRGRLNRREPESAAVVEEHVNEAEVIEEPAVVEVIASEESVLVDPSEIEVIEDGITFLDSTDSTEMSSERPAAVEPIVEEPTEDTGITFLD